ncbi:protein dopey 1 [Plakobranchus ocellatus]|uniref:Protein dopey 1 n=1 Tax=Plakobranchus ocellatus TaxID=259542 RepID=A0AAV4DTR8_9GAST|nr:protein dopey 1 [Plakobranchus ocellatus]
MFVVLDSLKEESSITKTLAITWLTHVIQRGDTSRVLQPLLLMLLHPDTARISIQHVSVHKPKKVSISEDGEDDVEAKIYAISSEGGNVIYHLSQPGPTKFKASTAAGGLGHSHKSAEELQSYAMSVMNTKTGTASTAPVRTHSVTDLSFERVNPQDISLRINPFGSASSLDKLIFDGYDFPQSASMPNLEGVKRLDSNTCRKEGIFFDGSDIVEDHFKAETASADTQGAKKDASQTVSDKTSEQVKVAVAPVEKEIVSEVPNTTSESENSGPTDGVNDARTTEETREIEKETDVVTAPVVTVITQPSPTEEETKEKDIIGPGDVQKEENQDESKINCDFSLDYTDDSDGDDSVEVIVRSILDDLVSSAATHASSSDDSTVTDSGSTSQCESSTFGTAEDNQSSEDVRKIQDRGGGDSTDSDSDGGEFHSLVPSSANASPKLGLHSKQNNSLNAGSMDSLLNSRGEVTGDDDGDNNDGSLQNSETSGRHSTILSSSSSSYLIDHRNLDPSTDIHELHLHMLLYAQQYDFRRTLYALSTLRAMLHNCPRLVVTAMATTSISAVKAPHLSKLQSLLGRHRKSVFGKNFFGELPPEVMSSYRSNMFVEIVISLCLYFVRGYYPNLMMHKLTTEELLGNKMVHILGVEILTLLLSELLSIMRESGKSFVSYISDLLSRCKLQKSLLHCLLASVYNMGHKHPQQQSIASGRNSVANGAASTGKTLSSEALNGAGSSRSGKVSDRSVATDGGPTKAEATLKLTEMIIDFNENRLDPSVNDTFQMRLLQLMLVTIMLEERIRQAQGWADAMASNSDRPHLTSSLLNAHYNPSHVVIQQEMFLSAVWSALKQHHQCHLHRHWVGLVTSALPYMGRALPRTVLCVILQLCRNLELMASDLSNKRSSMQRVPPDHMISMLEGLTTLCHYCLLDNSSPMSIGQPAPSSSHVSTETASAGQILTNLIHVFNPSTSGKEPSPTRDSTPIQPVLEARSRVLSVLPRVMACMATLWKSVTVTTEDGASYITCHPHVGDFKLVRHHILELLSPISLPHGTHLLAAFAVAWNDRRQKSAFKIQASGMSACEDQLLLVELVSAIKVLPTDTLIQTVKQVVKQPPQTELTKKGLPLEVNLLQFFLAYIHHTTTSAQLLDSWQSLLSLLRDCLQMNLSPPALFLLLQILHEFVLKTPAMEEKKHQKDLQDICQKALESVSAIAGSSLEQTTWLRRNFAVKPGPQIEGGEEPETQEERGTQPEVVSAKAPAIRRSQASDSKYSVQALSVLAELTAPILDVIYSSEEKDKVASFLTTLLYNVFPYLRHHSSHNLPSYHACSQMLSSISGYQYTRRSWRKEAFEMLMESAFFQMDLRSIVYWRVVIDNLMTHDKTTFKDLMGRVSINQTGSLNLFSSKEQEYEQRSQVMKRLAFTIFCSEPDQYQRAMPEIQERLAECLRLPQVANVMTSVFLCFRVLILRMSPQHLTSLWPTIITEMVQVLLQIEQELSTETDEFK